MRAEPKPLIVIVEDEEELARVVATHLECAGMQTQICSRGAHAQRFLKSNFANLMLLDINLPDQTGFALLEELRDQDISIPTIIVTGNGQEVTKIKGFELGSDDYVTKPFSYPELIARIKAVLRRAESQRDMNVTRNVKISDQPFPFCGAEVVPLRLEVNFPNGAKALIGRKELGIMAYLHDNPGVVITRKALIHAVWGLHADVKSRSLDQYIVKLRDLYRAQGIELGRFRTVHGVGYIFEPEATSAR